jgi:hypothetical protein
MASPVRDPDDGLPTSSAAQVDAKNSSDVSLQEKDTKSSFIPKDNGLADVAACIRQDTNTKFNNPLAGLSKADLQKLGRDYASMHGITEDSDLRAFEIGAILAQDVQDADSVKGLVSEAEMSILIREYTHKWSQPWTLKLAMIVCSICAAVQGMVCTSY